MKQSVFFFRISKLGNHFFLLGLMITGLGNLYGLNGFMVIQNQLYAGKNTFFFVQITEDLPVKLLLKIRGKADNYYHIQKKWEQQTAYFQENFRLEAGEFEFQLEIESLKTKERALWKKTFTCIPPEDGIYLSDVVLKPDNMRQPIFSGTIEGARSVKKINFSQWVYFPSTVQTVRVILYAQKQKSGKYNPSATAYTSLRQLNQVLKPDKGGTMFTGDFDIENLPAGDYLIEILWYEENLLRGEKSIPFSIVTEAYYWQERNIEESIQKAEILLGSNAVRDMLSLQTAEAKKNALKAAWKAYYPIQSEAEAYIFYEKIRKIEEQFEPETWRSDRAMTCIRYGQPTETRKFTTTHGNYEGWIYRQWGLMFMFKQNGNQFLLINNK